MIPLHLRLDQYHSKATQQTGILRSFDPKIFRGRFFILCDPRLQLTSMTPYLAAPNINTLSWHTHLYKWGRSTSCPWYTDNRSFCNSFTDPYKTWLSALASLFKITSTWLPVPFQTQHNGKIVSNFPEAGHMLHCFQRNVHFTKIDGEYQFSLLTMLGGLDTLWYLTKVKRHLSNGNKLFWPLQKNFGKEAGLQRVVCELFLSLKSSYPRAIHHNILLSIGNLVKILLGLCQPWEGYLGWRKAQMLAICNSN